MRTTGSRRKLATDRRSLLRKLREAHNRLVETETEFAQASRSALDPETLSQLRRLRQRRTRDRARVHRFQNAIVRAERWGLQ